jgi:hypothetical protein
LFARPRAIGWSVQAIATPAGRIPPGIPAVPFSTRIKNKPLMACSFSAAE